MYIYQVCMYIYQVYIYIYNIYIYMYQVCIYTRYIYSCILYEVMAEVRVRVGGAGVSGSWEAVLRFF